MILPTPTARLTTMNELSYVTKTNIGNCLDQDNGVRGPQVEIQGYPSLYLAVPPHPNYLLRRSNTH
jgi:hypothetical protein